jgi:TonB family protein
VFGIETPFDETRSEPLLFLQPDRAARLRSEPAATGDNAGDRREPSLAPRTLSPEAPPPSDDGERPVESDERRRPWGPVGSLLFHLLPVLLLVLWAWHAPPDVTAIPVQLVFTPPPPPPPIIKPTPKPVPKPKPETRPPPGRIASENLGETAQKGRDEAKAEAPAPAKQPAESVESPLEAPQQLAYLPPPPSLPDPPRLDLPAALDPRALAAPRPPQKPSPAARQPLRPTPQRAHQLLRAARYPGPASTRDEYLAYLAYLAHQHIGLLTHQLIGDRRGETIINVLVLDDGTVAMLSVGLSSGYPEIDERVEQMIRAVGRFPPLPQWFQGPSMRLEFRLQFPGALDG